VSVLDQDVLAERTARLLRHLDRVRDRLPERAEDLRPETDASDAVLLHLWQAIQIAIDLGVSACVKLGLGAPPTYGEAFLRLAAHGVIAPALAESLARAAGFRNLVAHAYDKLDLARVHAAARSGPADLLAFMRALRDLDRSGR
jgi:uncharacterized protein YutE (UPF0331/DUF86 family)